MRRGRNRWITAGLTLALGLCVLQQPAPAQALGDQERDALRQQLLESFEVVTLTRGLGLVARDSRELVEVAGGAISVAGRPVSGAELRERFGNRAPLLLRLSYLTDAELRALAAAPEPVAPPPPAVAVLPPPPVVAPEPSAPEPPARVFRRTGTRIGIVRSITVAEDEEVSDGIVVVGGSLRVLGRVRGDVVVVGGGVTLEPTAEVRGDITLVGGSLVRAPGAQVTGRVNETAFGTWDRPRWRGVGWPRVEFGAWPTLAGTVGRIVMLGIFVALVVLLARRPVLRVGDAVTAEPLRAVVVGVLAQVMFVPLVIIGSVALAITIIGIPFLLLLLPVVVIGAFVLALLGFSAVAYRVGNWIAGRMGLADPGLVAAGLLGLIAVLLPTLIARAVDVVPGPFGLVAGSLLIAGILVEYVAWTIGLGAAIVTGFGRWSTVPPPVPPAAAAVNT
jgi:hypothetical protein